MNYFTKIFRKLGGTENSFEVLLRLATIGILNEYIRRNRDREMELDKVYEECEKFYDEWIKTAGMGISIIEKDNPAFKELKNAE